MGSVLQSFTKRPLSDWSNLSPSNVTVLSILILVSISTWRHYDNSTHQNPFQQEVWIEWLSWALLFAFHNIPGSSENTTPSAPIRPSFWTSQLALWLTSAVAVASQLLSSQSTLSWVLPLTTIAVTLQARHVVPKESESEISEKDEYSAFLSIFTPVSEGGTEIKEQLSLAMIFIFNLLCFILLLSYHEISAERKILVLSLSFLLTRSLAVASISRLQCLTQSGMGSDLSSLSDTRRCLSRLSVPMLGWLTIILFVKRPEVEMSNVGILAHALLQAIWWAAAITLVRQQLVNTVANIDTIAVGAQMALSGTNMTSVATALLAFLVSATQSVVALRPGPAARRFIFVMGGIFVLVLWASRDTRVAGQLSRSSPTGQFLYGHPIEKLIAEKREHFSRILARQSKTIDQAVREYKRRYARNPPAGFDKWFELAQQHNFVLVDEFDTVMQSLEPFHGIHPSVVQQRIDAVLHAPEMVGRMNVVKFHERNVTIGSQFKDVGRNLFDTTWAKFVPYNVTVLLNIWDAPMVIPPSDEVVRAVGVARNPANDRYGKEVNQTYSTHFYSSTRGQNGWALSRHACPADSPSRQSVCMETTLEDPLSFISNAPYSLDVCQNCEIREQHSLLVSPGNMWLSTELSPIWSASKPSHFGDILYPSHYYNGQRHTYDGKLDKPWEQKDNKFYWVGRSTGGYATKDIWRKLQRHRFVLKTSANNTEPVQLLEEETPGSNKWVPRYSTMTEVRGLFATRMAEVLQCHEDTCKIEEAAFDIQANRPPDPKDAAYSHKFVVDVDGNGFSGRYYRLLQSKSVVIKSTILKEWHDDFLIPWVHYVPLSVGYHELPEMARFLATTPRGEELSERIARESTEWHNKVLRDIDLRLVWFRIVLEFGRILQPDLTL